MPFGNPTSDWYAGISGQPSGIVGASEQCEQGRIRERYLFPVRWRWKSLSRQSADGSQAAGTPCNKFPSSLINPIGQAMINLYPAPNANNASAGINYVNQPVRQLDETKFDVRLDHTLSEPGQHSSAVSAMTRHSHLCLEVHQGFAEANAFGSNQRIRNHARNVALGETHVFWCQYG